MTVIDNKPEGDDEKGFHFTNEQYMLEENYVFHAEIIYGEIFTLQPKTFQRQFWITKGVKK
jgi:hypothetical protein